MMIDRSETLAEYVTRVMTEKKLSTRDVAINSGNRIDQSQVVRIAAGKTKRLSEKTQHALADGLKVPREELFAVIYGTFVKDDYSERINILVKELPAKVQEDLHTQIEALHAKYAKK